ncbi:MAG: tRNA dihydrouridine synthase DusA [Cycloclasticus sp. symbiont of Bathymodiolus heckerae]|nr:MAG: tRNA dihydrouridine synthase DusA [Cycloclasticus sp. symbiont of Bathymodiolus heckerae]
MFDIKKQISVAPMMEWTDKHCRYFHRLLSPHALLYTEMVTTGALLHGDKERFLAYDNFEQPLVLQLGGSDPLDMAKCAQLAEQAGYQEVNINVGCPSDRVQNGRIGACLMAEPELVARCVSQMREIVEIPITVKTRIGIDESDSFDFLLNFVKTVADAGCDTLIIHARKAILSGLSPKENRTIPPLNYDRAYQLKKECPQLSIVINGGVKTVDEVQQHWQQVDGVMIGREAYHNPFFLADIEHQLFQQVLPDRVDILNQFIPYVEKQLCSGSSLQSMTRHILGLFAGQPGGKHWRRYLSENARQKNAGPEVLLAALDEMAPFSAIN